MARARYEQALPVYQEIGARLGEANCQLGLGDVAKGEKSWDQAGQFYQTALAAYRGIGIPLNIGLALRRLGSIAEAKGEPAAAISYYREALQIFETIGVKDAAYTREDLQRVQEKITGEQP